MRPGSADLRLRAPARHDQRSRDQRREHRDASSARRRAHQAAIGLDSSTMPTPERDEAEHAPARAVARLEQHPAPDQPQHGERRADRDRVVRQAVDELHEAREPTAAAGLPPAALCSAALAASGAARQPSASRAIARRSAQRVVTRRLGLGSSAIESPPVGSHELGRRRRAPTRVAAWLPGGHRRRDCGSGVAVAAGAPAGGAAPTGTRSAPSAAHGASRRGCDHGDELRDGAGGEHAAARAFRYCAGEGVRVRSLSRWAGAFSASVRAVRSCVTASRLTAATIARTAGAR